MTKMNIEIEIKNESELLRILGHNLKTAKSDSDKNKLNRYIDNAKNKISELKSAEAMN